MKWLLTSKLKYAGHSEASFDEKTICCENLTVPLNFKIASEIIMSTHKIWMLKELKFSAAINLSILRELKLLHRYFQVSQIHPTEHLVNYII
jgi:hypothetical protein